MNNLTIIIPFYKEVDHLENCLDSLVNQTDKSFDILVVNDKSPVSCESLLKKYSINIKLIDNDNRYGALGNMFHCMELPVKTKYVMVFHQDDILNPIYVEYFNKNIESFKDSVFIMSKMLFFYDLDMLKFQQINTNEKIHEFVDNVTLAKKFLDGEYLCFGSVVYNKQLIDTRLFNFEKYNTLGDRHFLLELLKSGKEGVVLNHDFVGYREHLHGDNRSPNLNSQHLISFYQNYLSIIENDLEKLQYKKKIFNSLIRSYFDLKETNRNSILEFYKEIRDMTGCSLLNLNTSTIRFLINKILKKK